jgi:chemotaxis response regulator CheB
MPRAAAELHAAQQILSLDQIAKLLHGRAGSKVA